MEDERGPAPACRYSAFISYNHRDVRWARWLHQALETYPVPKRLWGRTALFGEIGRRLPPVFRDREELASSADLAASVRLGLSESASLVVICSPHSAASRWVNEEVNTFIEQGRADRILCIIVDGEPHSGDPATECLPAALLAEGGPEPLAADARPNADGKQMAKLKLLAAILAVPFDELRQREAQRRQRRLLYLATASTAGLLVTSGLAIAAYLARNEAIEQRDLARVRTATAEQTVAFVKSMFEVADPSEARGSTITAREILDGARQRYRIALRNEPVVQSEIALTLSEVYGSLGLFEQSDEIAETIPAAGLDDPQVASRRHIVRGESLFRRGEFEDAAGAFRAGLRAQRASDQNNPALVSRAFSGLGQALSALDRFEESDAALHSALRIDTLRGDAGRRDVARDLEALGLNRFYEGDLDKAERGIERANRIRLALEGENSPSVSDNIGTLASIAYLEGRAADAERLFRSRLAIDERVLGKDHPDVAITLNNLGRVLVERRAFRAAEPLLERAIAITRSQRGDAYEDLAFMLASMAIVERSQGHADQAEALLREAIAIGGEQQHRSLAPNMVELASLLCGRRQFPEATQLLADAAPVMNADYPDDAWRPAWLRLTRAQCLLDAGRKDEARAIAAGALPEVTARWPAGSYYRHQAERLRVALGD
jgi:tetratricopeptide (TPR) repeat protein